MQWEKSNLNPPIWWQLRLAGGMLQVSVRHYQGDYLASVGVGYQTREAAFPTLEEAQRWGIREARKVAIQVFWATFPTRYPLLEVCLFGAIALGAIWLLGGLL